MPIAEYYWHYFTSYFTPFFTPARQSQLDVHQYKPPQTPVDVFEHYVTKPDPIPRLQYSGWSTFLYGYPSTGGVWITSPHPVHLQYLGLDRFTPLTSQRETDPVAEDEFCKSLKEIGAIWLRSHHAAGIEKRSIAMSEPDSLPDHVYIGWPKSGGVWFLKLADRERVSTQLGMLRMAMNMDEYCKVLEENGAVFYEDPKDCEYLNDVF